MLPNLVQSTNKDILDTLIYIRFKSLLKKVLRYLLRVLVVPMRQFPYCNVIFVCFRSLAPYGKYEDGPQASIRCPVRFESGGRRETPERRSWYAAPTPWWTWALRTWIFRAHVPYGAESSWTFLPKPLHAWARRISRWNRHARCPATSFAWPSPRSVACSKGFLTEESFCEPDSSVFEISASTQVFKRWSSGKLSKVCISYQYRI